MFKKGISIFESIIYVFFITIILFLCMKTNSINMKLGFIISIILLIFIFTSMVVFFISPKWLPSCCIYNIFGYIEIHIGNKCKSNRIKFLRACLNILLHAEKRKYKIMFDTNLIGRENLNRIFTDAINIFEPSIVQKFINLCFKIAYKNNRNKPFYRCIIDTKNLTPSQIDEIKLLAK